MPYILQFGLPVMFRTMRSLSGITAVAVGIIVGMNDSASAQSLVERYANLGSSSGLVSRGIVVPNAEVTFSSTLAAPIMEMPFKAGASFKKGDRLVSFDCGRNKAEFRGSKATLEKQRQILENRKKLLERNAASAFEVSLARSDYLVSKANSESIGESIKFCTIVAPFDGSVLELHADIYELPGSNDPLLTVIDDSSLEIDLIVPSKWLRWISIDKTFEFNVEETGESYPAIVVRLGTKIDSVSQTVKISGKFSSRPPNVLSGMSGSARFNLPTQ